VPEPPAKIADPQTSVKEPVPEASATTAGSEAPSKDRPSAVSTSSSDDPIKASKKDATLAAENVNPTSVDVPSKDEAVSKDPSASAEPKGAGAGKVGSVAPAKDGSTVSTTDSKVETSDLSSKEDTPKPLAAKIPTASLDEKSTPQSITPIPATASTASEPAKVPVDKPSASTPAGASAAPAPTTTEDPKQPAAVKSDGAGKPKTEASAVATNGPAETTASSPLPPTNVASAGDAVADAAVAAAPGETKTPAPEVPTKPPTGAVNDTSAPLETAKNQLPEAPSTRQPPTQNPLRPSESKPLPQPQSTPRTLPPTPAPPPPPVKDEKPAKRPSLAERLAAAGKKPGGAPTPTDSGKSNVQVKKDDLKSAPTNPVTDSIAKEKVIEKPAVKSSLSPASAAPVEPVPTSTSTATVTASGASVPTPNVESTTQAEPRSELNNAPLVDLETPALPAQPNASASKAAEESIETDDPWALDGSSKDTSTNDMEMIVAQFAAMDVGSKLAVANPSDATAKGSATEINDATKTPVTTTSGADASATSPPAVKSSTPPATNQPKVSETPETKAMHASSADKSHSSDADASRSIPEPVSGSVEVSASTASRAPADPPINDAGTAASVPGLGGTDKVTEAPTTSSEPKVVSKPSTASDIPGAPSDGPEPKPTNADPAGGRPNLAKLAISATDDSRPSTPDSSQSPVTSEAGRSLTPAERKAAKKARQQEDKRKKEDDRKQEEAMIKAAETEKHKADEKRKADEDRRNNETSTLDEDKPAKNLTKQQRKDLERKAKVAREEADKKQQLEREAKSKPVTPVDGGRSAPARSNLGQQAPKNPWNRNVATPTQAKASSPVSTWFSGIKGVVKQVGDAMAGEDTDTSSTYEDARSDTTAT
jgi:hypothetical protein